MKNRMVNKRLTQNAHPQPCLPKNLLVKNLCKFINKNILFKFVNKTFTGCQIKIDTFALIKFFLLILLLNLCFFPQNLYIK